jgi:hypothetical protein
MNMNMKLIAASILALFFSGALFSAEPMSADAVKSLLTNNTMNCKNLEKNKEFTNYYRGDGTVTKLTSKGEKIQGEWRVTDDGLHCHDWGKDEEECCHPIVDQGNGTYQKIEEGKPKAEFTVTEGNPKNL